MLESLILCTLLSSPHFGTRNAAEAGLHRLGQIAEPALLATAAGSDPEARYRAERCLGALLPGKLEAMFARHHWQGGVPWADSLPRCSPMHGMIYSRYCNDDRAIEAAKTEEQKQYPLWRACTRIWLTDCVYSGEMTLAQAEAVLESMVKRCPWWGKNGWTDPED